MAKVVCQGGMVFRAFDCDKEVHGDGRKGETDQTVNKAQNGVCVHTLDPRQTCIKRARHPQSHQLEDRIFKPRSILDNSSSFPLELKIRQITTQSLITAAALHGEITGS